MAPETVSRLFGSRSAVENPLVMGLTAGAVGLLAISPLIMAGLEKVRPMDPALRRDLWQRWRSWLVLAPLMMVPVLAGAAYTILAVGFLSLFCYREYARATGLFRERSISAVVVLGIVAVTFSSLDHWYGLFVALGPITVGSILVVAIFRDQPDGYVQRVGLGVLGFTLFGTCLGHLGYFGNDPRYREILFWLILCVELNDVFAYVCGKSLGRQKLAPRTSPNKTVAGAIGAMILTTLLAAGLGRVVFRGTVLSTWPHLAVLGMMVSVFGQFGDLLLSSIKRDVGIKDTGATFPGHGGVLDRFNSLLLVSPAVFHYVGYYVGVGLDQPSQIFTG